MARQTIKVTVKKIDGRDVSQHVRLLPVEAVCRVQPVTGDANDSEVFVNLQGVVPTKLTVDETVATLAGQIPAGWKLRFNSVLRGSTILPAPVDTLLFSHRVIDCRPATGAGATFSVTRVANVITEIAVVNGGQEYTRGATVVITGGGGSNAAAVPVIDSRGVITGITVTNGGTGYTTDPTITINPGSRVRSREQGVHYEEYLTTNTMANLETQLAP